jgi:hypothetical protein
MTKLLRGSLTAAVLACSLAAGAVQAALYNSHFDPPGAVTFAGEGTFYIDDICLAGSGVLSASTCHAQLMSADVDLTVTATSDTGHLDFGPSTDLFTVVIENGELIGVNSGLIGSVFPTSCTGVVCGTPWWIQWVSESTDPVYLYTGSCGFEPPERVSSAATSSECIPFREPVGGAFDVTFTRVPEPGSLALLAAGLMAAVGVRRRRSTR